MPDPWYDFGMTHLFQVEIGDVFMSFAKVSGLEIEVEFEPFQEGGVNDTTYGMAKTRKLSNLVFERGTGEISALMKWFQEVQAGKFVMKSGIIDLINEKDEIIRSWQFENALPVKWTGPVLDAKSGEIALEKMELRPMGLKEI